MSTTIIFIPGAWHGPEAFDGTAQLLRDAGFKTDYVNLASVGPKEHLKDMTPDVEIIRKHVIKAIDAGQKVVLVMHSYGGIPGTEAAHGLDYKTRQAEGKQGGIIHLYYCTAFMLPAGKTLISAIGGQDPPWFSVSEDKTEVNPLTADKIFYNDLPSDVSEKMVASLRPHSYQTMHSELTHASWQTVPSTYLYCLQDAAIPMAAQEMMVKEIGKGFDIRTDTVDASHSPMLSKPEETAASIKRAAELAV